MNHEFQRRANYDIGQHSYLGYFSKVPFLESNIKSNILKNKSFMEISNHTHLRIINVNINKKISQVHIHVNFYHEISIAKQGLYDGLMQYLVFDKKHRLYVLLQWGMHFLICIYSQII